MSPLTQPKVSSRYKVCSLLPDCLKGEVLVIETKEGGIGYLLHILKVRRTYRRTYLLDIGSGSLPIHECSVTVLYKRSVVLRKSKGIKDVIQQFVRQTTRQKVSYTDDEVHRYIFLLIFFSIHPLSLISCMITQ